MLNDACVELQSTPDAELARRAASGDREALGHLYQVHGAAAYSLAARLVGSDDAEDVVHDVFLSLPVALATYQERGAFGAWLRRVVARAALSRLRSIRRRGETELQEVATDAPPLADPDLERAIARLPPRLRSVLVLHAVEGFPHAEVASLLGISVIAARVRYSRAIAALRKDMGG